MTVSAFCPCCAREIAVSDALRTRCPGCGTEVLSEAAVAFAAARAGRTAAVSAEDDFMIEDGVLSGYRGKGGHVRIPHGVRVVGTQAFGGCASLVSVELPEGLVEVGEGAFARCVSLKEVSFPSTIRRIDADAFARCVSLERVAFAPGLDAASVRIDEDAFYCCGAVKRIEGWDGDLLV